MLQISGRGDQGNVLDRRRTPIALFALILCWVPLAIRGNGAF
jgi:hypothetical protein